MIKIFTNIGAYLILFTLSILTVHMVGLIGNTAESIDAPGIKYSLLTFKFENERNQPMTSKILLNIFVPNICMVLLYMFFYHFGLVIINNKIIWYVCFYFAYRIILICIILNRRELYRIPYELALFVSSMFVAHLICTYYLFPTVAPSSTASPASQESTGGVFITLSEFREEVWFSIILLCYKFVKDVLDEKVLSNKVIKDKHQYRYIVRMFYRFYNKYSHFIMIDEEHTCNVIFMYAVMILENYNRGRFIRKFERIKVLLHRTATTGIMQNGRNVSLSDEESIKRFYQEYVTEGPKRDHWVLQENYEKRNNQCFCNEVIEKLANKQNEDEEYVRSVDYIFRCLLQLIKENKDLSNEFFISSIHMVTESDGLVDEEDNYEENYMSSLSFIQVQDIKEITRNMDNNIYLDFMKGYFKLRGNVIESEHVSFEVDEFGIGKTVIRNLSNVIIDCNSIPLKLSDSYGYEIQLNNCKNITIKNLNVVNTKHPSLHSLIFIDCVGIIFICTKITDKDFSWTFHNSYANFDHLTAFKCEDICVNAYNSQVVLDKINISHCDFQSMYFLNVEHSQILMKDSHFHNNIADWLINADDDSSVMIMNAKITGNTFKSGICSNNALEHYGHIQIMNNHIENSDNYY